MNKNEIMQNTNDDYLELSELQKEKFSKIINKLLSVNFIYEGRKKDSDDYYFICRFERLFTNFLSLLDYDLHIQKGDKVIYIKNNQNYNHLHFKKFDSLVLLILRKMYFEKSLELQDSEYIHVTLGELHAQIESTGIYDGRASRSNFREAFSLLSRYNICEKMGDLTHDDAKVFIYPTINYILPYTKIEELKNKIEEYKGGELDENINESEIY